MSTSPSAPNPPAHRSSFSRWVGPLAFALLLLFSFYWVWVVGHRGVFLLDQSIVFDGAWRMAQGQVPYRDFVMPFGPVTFALQAVMFRIAGVDFSSLVLTAGLLSVIATAAAGRVVWLLSAGSWPLCLLAGLLTAVWCQAPFGIPWMEQTAFVLDLLALCALIEGRLRSRWPGWSYGIAGVASALAILSKQNAGGLFVFVCLGVILLPWRGRIRSALLGVLAYGGGAGACAALFVIWLLVRSDLATFVHYWFEVSAGIGLARVEYWKLLGTFFFQPLIPSSVPLFIASSLLGLVVLIAARLSGAIAARTWLSAWLCVSLPQFQSAFQLTTNNDAANNNAFVGLCVAGALALLWPALRARIELTWHSRAGALQVSMAPRLLMIAMATAMGLATTYSVGEGMMVAYARNVQEFAAGASFDRTLAVPGAERVRWGEPTRITPQFCVHLGDMCKISSDATALDHRYDTLVQGDFERIAKVLRERGQNFFVFPDATMLYGLTGKPSPQPLLYFHPGQSYLTADQSQLDRWIVESLRKNQVRLIVLERASFMGTHKLLSEFPRLRAFIDDNFRELEQFGNYRLLEARSQASSPEITAKVSSGSGS